MELYYESELYHHGIKGMKWGRRRFQNSDGSLTPAGKKRYVTVREAVNNARKAGRDSVKARNKQIRSEDKGEKVFNALKKGADRALDKAETDNFFNSDSIFSEKSMKRKAQINAARTALDGLDYNTLKSPNGRKQLVDTGKKVLNDYLDDADTRSFFNDDWDTRRAKQDRNDMIREFIK